MAITREIFASKRLAERTTGATNSIAAPIAAPAAQAAVSQAAVSSFNSFHDGTRERVRIGTQADLTWGIRIWDAAGLLIFNQTA